MRLVTFTVGRQEYGVDMDQIREVIRLPEIIPIPDVPVWVEGIMDLRGEVIPVVGLRKKLGLEASDRPALNRVLIAHRSGRSFGLVVDAVTGVTPIQAQDLSRTDALLSQARYLAAVARVGSRLVPMLDLCAMVSDTEAGQITAAGQAAMVLASNGPLSMDLQRDEETR